MVNKKNKKNKIRQKVQLLKDQEMIKLIPHAEDAIEKLSTDNTKDAEVVVIPKPK